MFIEYKREQPKTIQGYDLVKDNQISISPSIWNELRERFDRTQLQPYLADLIRTYNLPFPHRVFHSEDVRRDWQKVLNIDTSVYNKGIWNAPKQERDFEYKYLGKEIYFPGALYGTKVSDQFAHHERHKCASSHGNSPYEEWTTAADKKSNFLRVLFGLLDEQCRKKGVDNKSLASALRMHTYLASQFKPAVAKAFYDFFKAQDVLDFSSGWGDRLVGFHASGARSYTGIDPNSKMHPHYRSITKYCGTGKPVKLICSPAEDADLSDVSVDFVFTSPPYFNIEKYSQEGTQSWKRYKTSDAWVDGFLKPTLDNVWSCLREGGRLAVNIADKKGVDICGPMLDHMASKEEATYEGVLGYKMMKRPDSKGKHDSDYIFCEPVFIWAKGDAPEPRWEPETFFEV